MLQIFNICIAQRCSIDISNLERELGSKIKVKTFIENLPNCPNGLYVATYSGAFVELIKDDKIVDIVRWFEKYGYSIEFYKIDGRERDFNWDINNPNWVMDISTGKKIENPRYYDIANEPFELRRDFKGRLVSYEIKGYEFYFQKAEIFAQLSKRENERIKLKNDSTQRKLLAFKKENSAKEKLEQERVGAMPINVTDLIIPIAVKNPYPFSEIYAKYTGQVINGRCNGKGKWIGCGIFRMGTYKQTREIAVYEGEFKDGYFEGYGDFKGNVLCMPNKFNYELPNKLFNYKGYFKDGLFDGKGELTQKSEDGDNSIVTSTGTFVKGNKEGVFEEMRGSSDSRNGYKALNIYNNGYRIKENVSYDNLKEYRKRAAKEYEESRLRKEAEAKTNTAETDYRIVSSNNARIEVTAKSSNTNTEIYTKCGFNCTVKDLTISVVTQNSGAIHKNISDNSPNQYYAKTSYIYDFPSTINITYRSVLGLGSDVWVTTSIIIYKPCEITVYPKD